MALNLRRRTGRFTNVSLSPRSSARYPDSVGTGAASFKRVLGGAVHRPTPLPPSARDHADVRHRGFQGLSFATIAYVTKELPKPWRRCPIRPRVETCSREPAMRSCRGLVDPADARPTDSSGTFLLSQVSLLRQVL